MQSNASPRYNLEGIARALRDARLAKGWSQRELSARSHMPQAHISRIESGSVDLQVSSLFELARALDFDLQLVPRAALPAVAAIVKEAEARSEERDAARVVSQLEEQVRNIQALNPTRADIHMLADTVRELSQIAPLLRNREALNVIRRATKSLSQLVKAAGSPTEHVRDVLRLNDTLRQMRSVHVHAAPPRHRPAYSLDEED